MIFDDLIEEVNNSPIDSFTGEFRFLSNFYPCKVFYDGVEYSSVEHAYQAAKTLDPIDREMIRSSNTPSAAKKLGKDVELRSNWKDVKIDIMRNLIIQKFQDPFLKQLLINTGKRELIEGNWWNDTFWGVCKGVGENHLGIILMEIRSQLINT